jgi:hypothetical protein
MDSDKDSTHKKASDVVQPTEDKSVPTKSLPPENGSSKRSETGKGVIFLDGYYLPPVEKLNQWFSNRPSKNANF